MKLKKYTEAIQVVNEMLNIINEYYIKVDLGEVYYKSNNKQEALKIWHDIIKKDDQNPAIYQAVANSMIANRLVDEAINIYKTGRKITGKGKGVCLNGKWAQYKANNKVLIQDPNPYDNSNDEITLSKQEIKVILKNFKDSR